MKTWILLFRGINVGGRNILPMKALTELLEGLGFSRIRTYIQSGNVVLRSATKPGKQVAAAVESAFGFAPDVIVLGRVELESAFDHCPFQTADGKALHFFFAHRLPKLDADRVTALAAPSESWALEGNVFYLLAPDGIGRSKVAAAVEKCLGVPATARNLNTIRKLLELAGDVTA